MRTVGIKIGKGCSKDKIIVVIVFASSQPAIAVIFPGVFIAAEGLLGNATVKIKGIGCLLYTSTREETDPR